MAEAPFFQALLIGAHHVDIETSSAKTTPATPASTLSSLSLSFATVASSVTPSTLAPPSETVDPPSPSSSPHGKSTEGAAIGAPVAVVSVVIILLGSYLIRRKRRAKTLMADPLGQVRKRSGNSVKPKPSELPTNVAASEMEATSASEMDAASALEMEARNRGWELAD